MEVEQEIYNNINPKRSQGFVGISVILYHKAVRGHCYNVYNQFEFRNKHPTIVTFIR